MPVTECTTTVDGEKRPGRRWGREGKCYPCRKASDSSWDCAGAARKAAKQGRAIGE